MADNNTDTTLPDNLDPEKIVAHNAAAIQHQEGQDLIHAQTGGIDDAREAMRKLHDAQVAQAKASATEPVGEKPVIVPKTDGAPADEPAQPVVVTPAAGVTAAAVPPQPSIFDDVHLPPKASPKSAEAFATIKLRAAQELSARDKSIEELKAEVAKRDEQLQARPPEEATKELEELRAFKTRLDVEADPEWNKFDAQVKSTQEFIYAQLRKSPETTDAILADIKKYGGPENVNLDKLFEKIGDPALQRIVESKLGDIEMAKFNRENALKAAKENVTQYVAERRKVFEQSATAHNSETQKELKGLTDTFKWLAPQQIPAGVTEEKRKEIETHNTSVKDINAQVQAALGDDSPQMRAVLIGGMANFLFSQRVYAIKDAQYVVLEKKLAEATAQLEKVKGASISRLASSGAPNSAVSTPKPPTEAESLNERTGDALNRLRQQMGAERANV